VYGAKEREATVPEDACSSKCRLSFGPPRDHSEVLASALTFQCGAADRQLTRSFARSREREEHVVRARFPIYASLPARKVETMRPVAEVVAELLAVISGVT
jgi:hypothetical protein